MSTRWVLHLCGKLSVGGVQAVLMNYYKYIDKDKIQFAFAVQRDYSYEYDEIIKNMGGRIHYLPDMRYNPREYEKELKKLLGAHPEYQIVQAHFNFKNWKMLQIAKKMGVKNRISHAHAANKKERLTTKIHLGLLARLINYYSTDRFSCSIASGEYLYESDDFILIHNALELDKFVYSNEIRKEYRSKLNLEDNETALCEIGHLNDCKNQLFTVELLSKLDDSYKLFLVGVGDEYKEKLIHRIQDLQLENRVFFLGVRDDVNKLMQAFDLMVFPSKHEGLSVVCMEAQASGLPVITSNQVPTEVAVTDLIDFVSLESSDDWIDIIKKHKYVRRDTHLEMKDAGYDIKKEIKKLENIYLRY